jgi:hypothetical protein
MYFTEVDLRIRLDMNALNCEGACDKAMHYKILYDHHFKSLIRSVVLDE